MTAVKRAMLLCAGYGTRLGVLSDERPKPLLPVVDIPIIRYGIANLRGHGVTDIVVNLHHKGELFQQELGDGADTGVRVHYSAEPDILGTGGGLKNALKLLDPDGDDEPFLSHNGKLIFPLDVSALFAQHAADPDALGTLVIRPTPDAEDWGAVRIDDNQPARIQEFWGKGRHMFCGIHVTRPSIIRRLPDGESCSLRQGYAPWIADGAKVGAYIADGDRYFAEHSTPERYLQSNIDVLRGATIPYPPGPLGGIDSEAHVDASAKIREPVRISAGARIGSGAIIGPDTVVGRNATVGANAIVSQSVVWANARVADGARVERSIVANEQVVKTS